MPNQKAWIFTISFLIWKIVGTFHFIVNFLGFSSSNCALCHLFLKLVSYPGYYSGWFKDTLFRVGLKISIAEILDISVGYINDNVAFYVIIIIESSKLIFC